MQTKFDVFLSHKAVDKPQVELIAHKLRDAGLQPWLDKWELVPGEPWQPALIDGIRSSATVAVFVGPSGTGPWQDAETMTALNRALRERAHRVIPVLLPGAPKPSKIALPPFLDLFTWVDFRAGLDDAEALRRLIAGIRGEAPGPGGAAAKAPELPSAAPSFRMPKLPNPKFDESTATVELLNFLVQFVDGRLGALHQQGVAAVKFGDNPSEKHYVFKNANGSQYHLGMSLGGPIYNNGVSFSDGSGETGSRGYTAWARVTWDRETQASVVEITNMSLLRNGPVNGKLTREQLAEGIWDKICYMLEQLA